MKKLLQFFILFLLGSVWLSAQNLDFTLRYNQAEARYEVYARPDASPATFFWGSSQISIVAPAATPDITFLVSSVEAGSWEDNSRIFAPAADPANDYHGIGSLGGPVSGFVAGQERLIFYFTIPGEDCVPGLRLFVNGSDPDAGPDMGFLDFSQTIIGGPLGGSAAERYRAAYNNLGTACDCEGPIQVGGISNINLTLDADCGARVLPSMVLTGNYLCAADFEIQIDGVATDLITECGRHTYMIRLLNSAGEVIYTTWGYIDAEDKISPLVTDLPVSPAGLYCDQIDVVNVNTLPASVSRCWVADGQTGLPLAANFADTPLGRKLIAGGGIPSFFDGCSDVTICVNDIVEGTDPCDGTTIRRVFTARDGDCPSVSGEENAPTVVAYEIVFTRPTAVEGVAETADFSCESYSVSDPNPLPVATDYPFVIRADGTSVFLNSSFCNLGATYSDGPRVVTCENTYKFVRTFTVIDWCNPSQAQTFTQLVKVGDFEAPVITRPTQDRDFDGVADANIEFTTNSNDCTAFFIVPAGSAVDNCDNNPTVSVKVYLFGDLEATPFGPYTVGGPAGGFPIGRHTMRYTATDNCGNESILDAPFDVVDKTAPTAICEDGLNISIGAAGVNGIGSALLCAADIDRASSDECSDVTLSIARLNNNNQPSGGWLDCLDLRCSQIGTLRVGLRVTDAAGNTNFCWLDVLIEDKIAPVCLAPVPYTLYCNDLIGEFPQNVAAAFSSDPVATTSLLNTLFGTANGIDNCPDFTVAMTSVADNRNSCGVGTIQRRFRVTDAVGLVSSGTCEQVITVRAVHDYSIVLPADNAVACVDASYMDIAVDERGCDLLNISTRIDTFQADADECYKLRITYEILNWCEWNGEDDAYVIPRSAVDLTEPTWLHVVPNSITTLNDDVAFLDEDSDPDNGLPTFITNLDTGDGGIVPGLNTAGYGQDRSRGAFIYRQFVKVYDDIAPEVTVETPSAPFCDPAAECEADVVLNFRATDDCNQASLRVTARLDEFRDAGADGIYTLADFPANAAAITVTPLGSGDYRISLAGVAVGEHAVRIVANDACGNTTVELILFEVEDCKAPTPICINGLTVTLMPTADGNGMAEIWASDFIASPSADCSGEVVFSIYQPEEYTEAGFEAAPGQTGIALDCDDLGMVIVRIYAIDVFGNNDYCETTLFVQAFQDGVCDGGGSGSLAGRIATPSNQGMNAVEVNITDASTMNNMMLSQDGGLYAFTNLEQGNDYTVQPAYNPAVNLARVSTADLILISRHILGIQPLTGQYQLLAADVTQDNNINVVDIIRIRRVILGLDPSFTTTPSWRFYAVADGAEVINENNLAGAITGADFVAVEMGNVSDAIANAQTATGRGLESLEVEDIALVAGNSYEVRFEATDLAGYQATFEFGLGLELVDVAMEDAQATGFNLGQAAEGVIAVSHMGEGSFTLELRATADGQLSELLKLSNRITYSEAYPNNGGVADLSLNFVRSNTEAVFALEQNTPNPFAEVTKIGFLLPAAAEATLTVQDVQGRVILVRKIEGIAGYNSTILDAAALKGAAGVLTYTVTAGEHTATRKMVVLR